MPAFRKRPVVINAVQFDGENGEDCGLTRGPVQNRIGPSFGLSYYIETLEGRMFANAGDWIITGVMGEKYPCKPDIFAATYEPA